MTTSHAIDPAFTALPYRRLADAALARARDFHVSHADFRFERVRGQDIRVRDGRLQGASDTEDVGFAVRVILNGAWGFASGVVMTPEAAVQVAETAIRTAQVAAAMTTTPVALAPEPAYGDVEWVSAYEIDPLAVPLQDKVELLAEWSRQLYAADGVAHSTGILKQVVEQGRAPLAIRLKYWLMDAMEFALPARTKSENWPLEGRKQQPFSEETR